MALITQGDKALALKFEQFPAVAKQKLTERMTKIVDDLRARAEAAAPKRTGKLASEITGRVFSDQPDRVAGYVEVYAGGDSAEYPKAATLEYGTDKPRRIAERATGNLLARALRRRHLASRTTNAVHIRAFKYLRGPIEQMRPEIEAELAAAIAEATNE